ncbi:MAG: hypothetical protein KBC12_02535 [Candidatus Pacebacteria bacterium]|nr:hypothetical protein [Candidatus Paceibacterota bacterium]
MSTKKIGDLLSLATLLCLAVQIFAHLPQSEAATNITICLALAAAGAVIKIIYGKNQFPQVISLVVLIMLVVLSAPNK